MKRLFALSLLVGVLLIAMLSPVHAMTATINNVTNLFTDCATTNFVWVDTTYNADTDDGGGIDWLSWVIYDANGVVVSGIWGGFAVGTNGPVNAPTVVQFNAPTARPFTAKVHDIATIAAGTEADIINGPVLDSFEFDPSGFDPACATLPLVTGSAPVVETVNNTPTGPVIDPSTIPPDDRLNYGRGDSHIGILYARSDNGITIYGVDANSNGFLAVHVAPEDLPDCDPAPSENQLLASSADGMYQIWLLTTCEFQANIGPDAEGKVQVITWRGVPAIKESVTSYDFNVFEVLGG